MLHNRHLVKTIRFIRRPVVMARNDPNEDGGLGIRY